MHLWTQVEHIKRKIPLRTSRHTVGDFTVLVVTLRDDGCVGRGEATGVWYRGEQPIGLVRQLETVRSDI